MVVLAFALGCGGAPPNAIVEVEFRLPASFDAAGTTMTHVAFAARRGSTRDFMEFWSASASSPLGASPSVRVVSIEATERFEETLRLKVLFCADAACTDGPGTLSKWYEIEEPFRVGEFTSVTVDSSATDPEVASTEPEVIGRCFVAGCGAVPPASDITGFCDLSGRHPCD